MGRDLVPPSKLTTGRNETTCRERPVAPYQVLKNTCTLDYDVLVGQQSAVLECNTIIEHDQIQTLGAVLQG